MNRRDNEDRDLREKYKAVCILLAVIVLINSAVYIWGLYQLNKLQRKHDEIVVMQLDSENKKEYKEDYIDKFIIELNIIIDEALNMLINTMGSGLISFLATALVFLPKTVLKEIFKNVRFIKHYSETVQKIVIIEMLCVVVSIVFDIYAVMSNVCEYQEIYAIYGKVLSAMNDLLVTMPSFLT